MRLQSLIALLTSAVVSGLAGQVALAQGKAEANSIALDEVVVTARKKEESLQNAPIAVTAITAEDVDNRQIKSIDDVAKFAPGFVFSKAFGRSAERPVVRGLGSVLAGTAPGLESGTSYFVDGVYYPSDIQSLDLGDLKQVEVIRGPQSALYGRNTYAGAINFITRNPSKELEAKVAANADKDERRASLRVEGPLTENIGAALSARYYKFDGQWTNQLTGRIIGSEQSNSIQGTLFARAGDNVAIRLRAVHDEDNDGTRPLFFQSGELNNCYPGTRSLASFQDNITPSTNNNQYFCGTIKPGIIELNDAPVTQPIIPVPGFPLTASLNAAQAAASGLQAGSLYSTQKAMPISGVIRNLSFGMGTVDWDIGGSGYKLTLDGGIRSEKRFTGSDSDHSALNIFPAPVNGVQNLANGAASDLTKIDDVTMELKVASPQNQKLRWLAGLYHYEQDVNTYVVDFYSLLGQKEPWRQLDIYNRALFGSLEYDFTDTISGTAELRRAEEVVGLYDRAQTRNADTPGASNFGAKTKFTSTTPRVTLNWKITPDFMAYAVFAKGNKPGGFNGSVAIINGYNDNATFNPEETTAYELGFKADWFERRVSTAVAFYRNKIKDMQLTTPIQNANSGAVTSIVTNQGSGTSQGVEVDVQFKATRNLKLGLQYALADTKFTEGCDDFQYQLTSGGAAFIARAPAASANYTGRGTCSIVGNPFPLVAKNTGSLTADYERPAFGGGDRSFYWNSDLRFEDKKPVQVHNNPWTGSATLLGMRLGFKTDKWRLGIYGRNLTNEDSVVSATRWLHQFLFATGNPAATPNTSVTLDPGPARFMAPPAGSGLVCPATNPVCVPAAQYSLPRGFFGALRQQRQIGIEGTWNLGGNKSPPPPAKPVDSDGDGVPDEFDKCPNTPAGAKVDATGCELDSDGDGVVDRLDKCPNTPAGAKVDANGCELDSDGDGVVDRLDKCPGTPKGDRVDINGCSFKTELKLPGVVFESNKADLKPESSAVLDDAVTTLKRYPELIVEVAGHTDSVGGDARNVALSKSRAETVMRYLTSHGVSNTLRAKGYGKKQPVASNKTADGRAENRRVVLRILDK